MQKEIIEGFRLSLQQKHLWLLQEADQDLAYRTQGLVLIEGTLDSNILKAALDDVVARQEILRTTFQCLPGMTIPLQVINEKGPLTVRDYDLSGWNSEAQETKIEKLLHEATHLPFDFQRGPLLDLSLIILSADKHMLLITVPALCADGWGLKNLVREITLSYTAYIKDEARCDKPMQYADLAEWQHELLESEDTAMGKEYWRKRDLSALSAIKAPFERQSYKKSTFHPQFLSLTIGAEMTSKIESLVGKYNCSTSAFLLACWEVLIWRLTAQSDIIVGSAYDGRRYEELEEALGPFTKYLPFHCRLEENFQFSETLADTDQMIREAYKWQECFSWDHVRESLGTVSEPSFLPICFDFDEESSEFVAGDATFSIYKQYACIDRYKLKLSCARRGAALIAEFHYDSSLFCLEDIKRLEASFSILLENVIDNPEASISKLNILSDLERQRLLVDFNLTNQDYAKDRCIHQLFEEQAERTPDSVAVVVEDQKMTYAELNARANSLAHHLQTLGIGPDVLVALCVERSPEMVVALLGVLKAGGAYVPLDPVLPKERLAFIIEDAQAPLLLTQQRLIEGLPEHRARVVCLDKDWDVISQQGRENLPGTTVAENLVYVIYTSGTTGKPKGVAVEHRQLLNYVNGIVDRLALPAGASFATVSTFGADLGNTAIFPSLCSGGCLHLVSQECASDPQALANYMSYHTIDCLKIVPSHLKALLTSAQGKQILPRQRLVLGGEASNWDLIKKLQALSPDCLVFNHYGPTETTVGVLTYQVPNGKTGHPSATIPLGRPIANTQIYILDQHLQPVPAGVPGELYVGGDNLARGYLNHPELTAEKFISNPFSDELGARLYKTGDLARYLPDANVEFLGRIDHQIKIRGFRIELAEIEVVLAEHPAVREIVVTALEDALGEKRLVAYLVPSTERMPTFRELSGFLKEKLPEYMIPTSFVVLDALPLTRNGKVDRYALPAPEQARSVGEENYVAPKTATEEALAGIWAEVLGLEQIGIHDNFFDLGGHSLLITQIISRIRKACQVDMPLRSLFELPTVAALAENIELARQSEDATAAPPLVPFSREGELPLSFSQQRLWFADQLDPNSALYSVPRNIRMSGDLNVEALHQTLNAIVARHETLRVTFATVAGGPVQVITPTLSMELPVIDLRDLSEGKREAEVLRLVNEEAQRPFDLSRGPLVRASLLRLDEEEHVLLLNMHHIISDGWSAGVLFRELGVLYEAFSTGKPSPLPELPIQYADYAVWQRQWLQGEVLEKQLNYWRKQLAGVPAVLNLPTDRPRPAVPSYRGDYYFQAFSESLTKELKVLSLQEGATLFMTSLAAFQALLNRYSHQNDIVVGTDVANRNFAETEGLIGFFINHLVLRTDLSGDPTFREFLGRVREVALGAYAHQDVPFEKLVEELQPERSLKHTPLFQVLFVLQNAPKQVLELKGLTLNSLPVDSKTSKFDLALFLEETDGKLVGTWWYKTDLFEAATIIRMAGHYETLLGSIVAHPDARLSALELLNETEREQQDREKRDRKKAKLQRFKNVEPKPVNLSHEDFVKTGYLRTGETLPLMVQPQTNDINLAEWAGNNRSFIETELAKHGAILFRGFNVDTVSDFEQFAQALCSELFGEYGDLPREGVSGKVYGSTPYPSEQAILFHNESSHMHRWPMKIWFYCVRAAQQGGETPIVDCRKIYELIEPNLRERFAQKGLMYVRNYTDELDVNWRTFFHTEDRSVVEDYCRKVGMDFEWKNGDGLRTRQVCPAVAKHPKTGEMVFFNQIQLHHVSCLEPAVRESILSMFREEDLPRNVYYGDGSPIEDSVMEEILEIYRNATVSFPWQEADIIMLDNMLAAHGRNPFVGERKIVVTLGEMINKEEV